MRADVVLEGGISFVGARFRPSWITCCMADCSPTTLHLTTFVLARNATGFSGSDVSMSRSVQPRATANSCVVQSLLLADALQGGMQHTLRVGLTVGVALIPRLRMIPRMALERGQLFP